MVFIFLAGTFTGWVPFFRYRSSNRIAGNLSKWRARSKAACIHDGDVIEEMKLKSCAIYWHMYFSQRDVLLCDENILIISNAMAMEVGD